MCVSVFIQFQSFVILFCNAHTGHCQSLSCEYSVYQYFSGVSCIIVLPHLLFAAVGCCCRFFFYSVSLLLALPACSLQFINRSPNHRMRIVVLFIKILYILNRCWLRMLKTYGNEEEEKKKEKQLQLKVESKSKWFHWVSHDGIVYMVIGVCVRFVAHIYFSPFT